MSKKNLIYTLIIIALIYSCAKISRPTGGPKDIEPPVMTSAYPAMGSSVDSTFDGEIEIEFDEIIKLKDVRKQLVVSPPLIEKPIVKATQNVLEVDLNNELYGGETYTLNFGNSVTDYNEGNVLNDFIFVFTTGESIDTMEVAGNVKNAYSHKPIEQVTVMLYPENIDSLPYNSKPRYIAKTNKEGRYRFTNLKRGKYKVFAATDNNNNYQYDPIQGESIAFTDSIISPSLMNAQRIDTTIVDSLRIMFIDTINYIRYLPDSLNLYLFAENTKKQYILNRKRTKKNIMLQFSLPVDTFNIRATNAGIENWGIREFFKGDSIVNYWITDTTVYKNDSLSFHVDYLVKDKESNEQWIRDSIFFRFREKKIPKGADYTPETLFTFKSDLDKPKIHYYSKPKFTCESPILDIDTSKIRLFELVNDSTKEKVDFKLDFKQNCLREFIVDADFKELKKYELEMDSTAFTDVYDLVNDSIIYTFAVSSNEEYGSLKLQISGFESYSLFQLTNAKGKVIDEVKGNNSEYISFKNLIPSTYKIRVIQDANNNYTWDVGHYLKHIQPEEVIYYNKELKVIKNWETEESWLYKTKKK
jgi:uncharacterized protein (DUF2141 family)